MNSQAIYNSQNALQQNCSSAQQMGLQAMGSYGLGCVEVSTGGTYSTSSIFPNTINYPPNGVTTYPNGVTLDDFREMARNEIKHKLKGLFLKTKKGTEIKMDLEWDGTTYIPSNIEELDEVLDRDVRLIAF